MFADTLFEESTPNRIRPIIKWAGGKSQLMPVIEAMIPKEFVSYREIFLGGAAVLLSLQPTIAFASDTNERLINLYSQIKFSCDALLLEASSIEAEYNSLAKEQGLGASADQEAFYYERREEFNSGSTGIRDSALFLFLNKAGFNGLYRENRKGLFNIPFGRRAKIQLVEAENAQNLSDFLANVELKVSGFESALASAECGDFVYADPPYVPLTDTASFTAYQSQGFDYEDQVRLRDLLADASLRGVQFLLSNSDTPIVRDLYADFTIESVSAKRNVGASARSRNVVNEVLVRNY